MLSYESTRPWARSIKTKVESRQMPPWFADPHVQEFANNPSLSDAQVSMIARWVDGGAVAGDSKDAPPPVQWAENGWTVRPDFVIKGMEYPVPAHTPKEVIEWATYYVPNGAHPGHLDYVARDQAERVVRHAPHLRDVRRARSGH